MSKRIDRAKDMYDAIENVKSILWTEKIHNITDSEIESTVQNREIPESEIEDAENFPLQYYVDDVVSYLTTLSKAKEEVAVLYDEYEYSEIKELLRDGEALKKNYSKELAEAMYAIVLEKLS